MRDIDQRDRDNTRFKSVRWFFTECSFEATLVNHEATTRHVEKGSLATIYALRLQVTGCLASVPDI
ncbi:hypothetical protein OG21DRAFT_138131 [Imleria badia]|nr:hypothetical protein OG21DRAFT_138131 [Imleria badia]